MHRAEHPVLTEAEYLALEAAARELRHEYVDGAVYAMSGGSLRHNRISTNALFHLMLHLRGKPCQVYMSDVKLCIASDNAYYYPDVMVNCAVQRPAANETQAISNPVLVIEVLSPTTETVDRREKLRAYRRLPSLQEYGLISQEVQRVEIYRRQGDIGWLYLSYEPNDTVELASLGMSLPLAAFYEGTDVSTAP